MEENTTTAAAPAPQTSSAPATSAPSGGGAASAEPVASAEPTAAPAPAPASAAPAPAAPKPAPDSFGWDDWDGSAFDAFPEDVRPWLEKAHGRLNQTWDEQRSQLEQRAKDAAARAEKFRQYWESAISGMDEDPRLSEYDQARQQAEAAAKQAQEYAAEVRRQAESMVEAETQRYMTWAIERAGGEKAVQALLSGVANEASELADLGYEPHNIFDIARFGPEAMKAAVQLAKDGVKENYALRLLKAEYGDKLSPSKTEAAPAAPSYSAAAQAVAGAKPAHRPEAPAPTPINNLSMSEARMLAAKRALAGNRK